ncbi:MAG TPA: TetR-like C-terminal domain-containing protein [Candidatus Dormibacteraeota bacterium]
MATPAIGAVVEAPGIEPGDLPTDVDQDLLIDLLIGPFYYRIFITGHRVEPDLSEKLVDFVLLRHIPKVATRP